MIDAEAVLAEHGVTVTWENVFVDGRGNRYINDKMSHWALAWENGVMAMPWRKDQEEMARATAAMFVYLWLKGVPCEQADELALCWVRCNWARPAPEDS